jgi:hypothetical protein
MRKFFSKLFETYVINPLRKIPGEEKFGNYRFLPLFFLFGATVEYLMIHLKAGPNQVNFCKYNSLYNINERKRIIYEFLHIEN